MTKTNDKTLIIIPCLNEENYIEPLIEQLNQDTNDLNVEIIIADGGSTDETIEIAKNLESEFDHIHLLNNPKKIQSAAINLAVETYGENAEYLIRIDAHADYPSDFCQTLLEEADETKAESVVIAMETSGKSEIQEAVAYAQNSVIGNGGSAHRNAESEGKFVDHGHHALMNIKAFTDIGGYDETFTHNEDAELDKRLSDAGYKIWLTDKTYCTYYPRDNFWALFKQYKNYGYGRAKTIIKHNLKPKPRQLAPAAVLPALIIAFLFTEFSLIFALPIVFWALLCLGYGYYLGHKADKPHVCVWSGLAAMTMHIGWSIGFWYMLSLHAVSLIKERINNNDA